jgi:hypothetical protein
VIPLYFLLLMADGRKLRGKLLDRLTLAPRGRILEGQEGLFLTEHDLSLAYAIGRDQPEERSLLEHPRGAPSFDERAGSGPSS